MVSPLRSSMSVSRAVLTMVTGAYGSVTTNEVYFGIFEYLVSRFIHLCPSLPQADTFP